MAAKGAAIGAIKVGVGATPAGIKGATVAAAVLMALRGAIITRGMVILEAIPIEAIPIGAAAIKT
jgi:hypothetical protein